MTGARFLVDHRFARRHLSAYVEQDLEASQRRRVERHLVECPECDRVLRSLRRLLDELARMCRSAPGRVVADVHGRLRAMPPPATGAGGGKGEPHR